jgi:hypothetical protein
MLREVQFCESIGLSVNFSSRLEAEDADFHMKVKVSKSALGIPAVHALSITVNYLHCKEVNAK